MNRAKYNTKINDIENVTGLVANAAFNTKTIEMEVKVTDIINLTNKMSVNTKAIDIEKKKTLDTTTMIKNTDYNQELLK